MQACRNPDDTDDIPKHLPAGFSTYVLNSLTKSPPYHVTLDEVSPPPERVEVEQDTNSFAAVVALLRYSTTLIGLGSTAPPGKARWTYKTSDPTFFGTGRAHQHNTARPTAYTARCASVQPAANYCGLGRNIRRPGLRPRPAYSLASSRTRVRVPLRTFLFKEVLARASYYKHVSLGPQDLDRSLGRHVRLNTETRQPIRPKDPAVPRGGECYKAYPGLGN